MAVSAMTPPERVLILNVDDNEAALYAKTRTLRQAGFEVIEASRGDTALALVKERRPVLVLLDVKLPDISGLEVCRQIKERHPEILVLQISASFVARDDRIRGLDAGADSYLTQPIAPNELLATVRALLRMRETEVALRASEARLQAILASATDYAIITLDEAGLIVGWNAGATALFGWTENEAKGRHIALIFTEPDRMAGVPAAELHTARTTGRAEDTRWQQRKDGSRFFASGVATRLEHAPVDGFVKILRDQTVQRDAEEALQNLNASLERRVAERTAELREANERLQLEIAERARMEEQLRHSQKMEVVGQLTGGIAHDFNNLLQIITGNLETLGRRLSEDDPRLRRAAENAMIGARRAATLTQRLLAFSRRQPLAPRPTDVNQLILGMRDMLNRALGETISLETILAPDLWPTETDQNQLENAILNLAVNSRDAMASGGKLTIITANQQLSEADIVSIDDIGVGQYVLISVVDTGAGMDAATVERAFEPFFTTKDVGRGTGLGLSMAYGFARQSGGKIQIESALGAGTTVKLFLPRMVGASIERTEPEDAAVPRGSPADTILVVEDDDDVRAYSVEVLRELGYRVLEAHDGESALRLLERAENGSVGLLFTDVVLPGGDTGEHLAAQARALMPGLNVLFTTGYARDSLVRDGRLNPDIQLITKPFSHTALASKIRSILRDASPEADEV